MAGAQPSWARGHGDVLGDRADHERAARLALGREESPMPLEPQGR